MTLISILVTTLGWSTAAFADDHVKGVISGRGQDGTYIVQTDSAAVAVVLADATKIRRVDGVRSKRMSSANLIPGLRVDASGVYDGENHFVASRITFSKTDLKIARDIENGIATTDQRSLLNQQQIEQQAQSLRQQDATLDEHGQLIAANSEKIVATSGAVDATNARLSNLDDYNILASVTVYFANGKASIAPRYKAELKQLAEQARSAQASIVQVQGFASAVGSDAVNQQLSMKRADAVTAVLQQSGVAPTSVVVPAAMGTTQQVASNRTAQGQSQNRRAVVTLLQNKGITGK
jgi:outer membrane protein OmpA-like peptidoglycan-associated protein